MTREGGHCALLVRPVEQNEIEKVYRVEASSFDNPYPLEYLTMLSMLLPEYFLVIEECGTLAGYVIGAPLETRVCHILSIAVAPSRRGRKLGSILLESLLHVCEENGYREAILEVEFTNTAAQALYRAHGFHVVTVLPDYYGDRRHALVMARPFPLESCRG